MSRHQDQTINHIIESWTYANAAARTGATGFLTPDIGRIAYQADTGQYWRLTAVTPTWAAVTLPSIGPAGTILKSDGSVWSPSTETYAAPGAAGRVMRSDGTNWASAVLSQADINPPLLQMFTKVAGINTNLGANDNAVSVVFPAGYTRWRYNALLIYHPSAIVTTGSFQLFSGPGATGVIFLNSTTTFALTSAAENTTGNIMTVPATSAAGTTTTFTQNILYFRTVTASGVAATVDIMIVFNPLS